MRHFQGIDDIKAATVEELSGLPGMNKKGGGAGLHILSRTCTGGK